MSRTGERRLRIGVLGTGRRGTEHLRSILAMPERYELAAVCDLTQEAVARVSGLADAPSYTSPRRFFAEAGLDVVVITTPRETHHVMVSLVAEYGVNMLIETPLATTRAMMDVIEEVVARHSSLKIEVAEQMWRRPAEWLNRQAIAAGHIGDVQRVTSFYGPAGGNSCYHTMSLMRSYAGADAEEVQGLTQARDDEIWTQGILRYANGVVGSVTYVSNWTGPLRRGHPRFFSVEGTAGFLITGDCPGHMLRQLENGAARDYAKRIETHQDGEHEYPTRLYYETTPTIEWENPFLGCMTDDREPRRLYDEVARAAELTSIHRAVTTGAAPSYTVAQARRDMELSILLTESARRGAPLPARGDVLGPETEWEREQHEAFRQTYRADPIKDLAKLVRSIP
jgi:predicted dehydrogenase